MIRQYYRPKTMEEALSLLQQAGAFPLGGGTVLTNLQREEDIIAVDLQELGLGQIEVRGNSVEIGARVTLQQLMEWEGCPDDLRKALWLEAPLNLRNMATLAGTIVSCDGRSPLVTALLGLDARLTRYEERQPQEMQLGDFLPFRPRGLITAITLPVKVRFAFEYVARTPADIPIVCVALTRWPSGRTRLTLGGWGDHPRLAMDGPQAEGIELAARNAFYHAEDERASAEYRREIAAVLARRALEKLE
ncbi:MAG: FAD binding domain-containing protein [Anaerolineales bacterium]